MKKKLSINAHKKKVWQVFSKWIRQRDDWTCITCGKRMESRAMHAGHYISRRYNATLFDPRNVHAQCMYCNMYQAGNIATYTLKLQEMYGEDIIKKLEKKSKEIKQFTHQELDEIMEKYKLEE